VDISCGGKLARVLIILTTTITLIAGIALLIVGCLLQFGSNEIRDTVLKPLQQVPELEAVVSHLKAVSTVAIVSGSFLFILSFCGCFGALWKNRYMLIIFAVLMSVLVLAEFVVAIVAIVMGTNQSLKTDVIEKALKQGANQLNNEQNCKGWQNLQNDLQCCGLDGSPLNETQTTFCTSHQIALNCTAAQNQRGCVDAMFNALENSALTIGIVVAVFVAFELFTLIFSICLAVDLKRRPHTGVGSTYTYGRSQY